MHVLIVGAGLGGLTLAQCLRKQGVSFEIFERDENEKSRFQGWAIAIHGAMVSELASSFPSDVPDLRESTNHLAPLTLPAQICMYFPGKEGRIGVEDAPELPIIRAERQRLRSWLALNLNVQWGKQVTRIEHDDKGVTVYFADGSSAKGDVLVGADGINSVVREHLVQIPSSSLLNRVPLAAIVGQVTLSGDKFKRQLELGHSGYMFMSQGLGFFNFCGLHHVLPDGVSGRHYWMFMQHDPKLDDPDHWLQTASQQEKLDYVLKAVAALPPRFREIFELTPADGIKKEQHIWRDLELGVDAVPDDRVILLGDAAHAMTPFRGEGGHHALIDSLKLSKVLGQLNEQGKGEIIESVKAAVAEYNFEMLTRGSGAVRDSRNMGSGGKPGEKPKAWIGAKPIPEKEIVLGENIKAT